MKDRTNCLICSRIISPFIFRRVYIQSVCAQDPKIIHPSLATERFYGVSEGRTDRLNTYRHQGNGERQGAGYREDPPRDLRTIAKSFEPVVHGPPRDGECDERSDRHKHREVFAEQTTIPLTRAPRTLRIPISLVRCSAA